MCCCAERRERIVSSCLSLVSFTVIVSTVLSSLLLSSSSFFLSVNCLSLSLFLSSKKLAIFSPSSMTWLSSLLGAPTGQSRGYLVEIQLGRPSCQLCTNRYRDVGKKEKQQVKERDERRERKSHRLPFLSSTPLLFVILLY